MRVTTEIAREASRLTKEEWREYTKTVWHIANVSHRGHPAVFPAEIPHRLVKLFSFVGEIVLDPFAGIGTTAAAATTLDRRAISVELNPDYATVISESVPSELSEVHIADSRDLGFLEPESVDLTVTSPPYWNKADYGGDSANLGNIGSYPQFFDEMRAVFTEIHRVLRPGRKVCIVTANVNQHTDHGLLTFPLAADFTILLRNIGFVLINELIWSKDRTGGRWGSAGVQRPIFGSYPYPPNFLFKNVHEYILIFAKPPARATTGPKVLSYQSLMTNTSPSGASQPSGRNGNGTLHPSNGRGHSRNGKGPLPER